MITQETISTTVMVAQSAKTRRARKKLYYAKHREELLFKNRIRYHTKPEQRREAARRAYALDSERKKAASRRYARMKYALDPTPKREASVSYYARRRDEILLKRRINY